MKNKIEQELDFALNQLKVTPRVYHFYDVKPFTAVTIVEDILMWNGTRREMDKCSCDLTRVGGAFFSPATHLREMLKRKGIYGIAICDRRDRFNRQRGRIIAKGRFLKHLKEIEKL